MQVISPIIESAMQTDNYMMLTNFIILFILKLTCLVIGYLVIRTGADLLREGVKGEFKFKSSFVGGKADLVSASPGLLFLLLGTFLIGYALHVDKSPTDKKEIHEERRDHLPTPAPQSPLPSNAGPAGVTR